MNYNFKTLEENAVKKPSKSVALAMAEEDDALAAIAAAAGKNIVKPILVGNPEKIKSIASQSSICIEAFEIIEADGEKACAQKAVELVKSGKADCLMKGKTATSVIMKAALDRENGLSGSGMLSHLAIIDIKSYHKLLIATDAAMNIAPELKEKVLLTENAVKIAHTLGIEKPLVAVIGAVEKVNPSMPCTLDAAMLSKMADRGQIKGCIIDGPFALDNAISKHSCEVKGISGEVGGNADILLFPDIEAANVFYKTMAYFTDCDMAGIIAGASAPIILTSRADSERTKYLSILAGVSLC